MALRAFAVCAVAVFAGMATAAVPVEPAESDATAPIRLETGAELVARAAIEKALDQKVTVEFKEEPLEKAIEKLTKRLEVNVHIDAKALEAAGVPVETPITQKFSGITVRSALRLMLKQVELTTVIKEESLVITSPEAANEWDVTRVYPVADLGDLDALSETIQKVIGSATWEGVGGTGSIDLVEGAGALAISQTGEIHEEIGRLLTALRKARDLQGIKPVAAGKAAEKPAEKADDAKPPAGGLPTGGGGLGEIPAR